MPPRVQDSIYLYWSTKTDSESQSRIEFEYCPLLAISDNKGVSYSSLSTQQIECMKTNLFPLGCLVKLHKSDWLHEQMQWSLLKPFPSTNKCYDATTSTIIRHNNSKNILSTLYTWKKASICLPLPLSFSIRPSRWTHSCLMEIQRAHPNRTAPDPRLGKVMWTAWLLVSTFSVSLPSAAPWECLRPDTAPLSIDESVCYSVVTMLACNWNWRSAFSPVFCPVL